MTHKLDEFLFASPKLSGYDNGYNIICIDKVRELAAWPSTANNNDNNNTHSVLMDLALRMKSDTAKLEEHYGRARVRWKRVIKFNAIN